MKVGIDICVDVDSRLRWNDIKMYYQMRYIPYFANQSYLVNHSCFAYYYYIICHSREGGNPKAQIKLQILK